MAIWLPGAARAEDKASPRVAAASDLQFALPEIVAAFRRASGHDVRLTFGSSGNLRRQIADGAPFDIFLSADGAYADTLVSEHKTAGDARVYAIGRIALFVPNGVPITPDAGLADLGRALDDGRVVKFAIANPEHAPYGRASREALVAAGLWDRIAPRLVLGENISQAAQFAVSGAAQGGIVAYSMVRSGALAGRGRFALLPATMHGALTQKMVLLGDAAPAARTFFAFLQSTEARAIFQRHGFELPPATTAP